MYQIEIKDDRRRNNAFHLKIHQKHSFFLVFLAKVTLSCTYRVFRAQKIYFGAPCLLFIDRLSFIYHLLLIYYLSIIHRVNKYQCTPLKKTPLDRMNSKYQNTPPILHLRPVLETPRAQLFNDTTYLLQGQILTTI